MALTARRVSAIVATITFILTFPAPALAATRPPAGSWEWPIRGQVLRGFEPPSSPYGPGHRGIDIAAEFGTPVRAPADGTVSFGGAVAGSLFLTIDHGDGYRSTSSFLSQVLVQRGDPVTAGEVVALSGRGHPGEDPEHLHFGVRLNGDYVDPIPVLAPQSLVDLIELAPLAEDGEESSRAAAPRMSALCPEPHQLAHAAGGDTAAPSGRAWSWRLCVRAGSWPPWLPRPPR